MGKREADRTCMELARTQWGLISRAQALEAGQTDQSISRRFASGQWMQIHPGVYALPLVCEDRWMQSTMAATLALPEGVAFGRTAAALHRLHLFDRDVIEVVSQTKERAPRGVIGHYTNKLPAHHVTTVEGIPTTTLARTFCDLGYVARPGRIAYSLDGALMEHRRLVRYGWEAIEYLGVTGRPPVAQFKRLLLARSQGEYDGSGTAIEKRFRTLIKGIRPAPVEQFEIPMSNGAVAKPDFAWPRFRIAAECDSWKEHLKKVRRLHDARRDNILMSMGWIVLRFYWEDIVNQPNACIARIEDALSLRGAV